jgi:hypothetical protein
MDDRLTEGRGHATAVLGRLEHGEPLARVAGQLRLGPAALVGALAAAGLGGDDGDDGPTLVRRAPKRPWLRDALDEAAWAEVLPRAKRAVRLALAAGLLQVHDFWDASHEAAQQADDLGEREFSAYWHGIAHRREPDPGNAAYWFRRVGRHPLFGPLGEAAGPWLDAQGDPNLATRLVPGGTWSPFAFIDFCGEARRNRDHEALARRLQRLEMATLLGATADAATATDGH